MMLKKVMKKKIEAAAGAKVSSVTTADIEAARSLIFSVFTRYGDAIISLKVIAEFIAAYPDKKYYLVTNNQLRPYAERLVPGANVKLISLDKRRNPVRMLNASKELKAAEIDIGFNPYSLGDDSEYFISFAEKYLPFKDFCGVDIENNLYERARNYMLLTPPPPERRRWDFTGIKNIVVAPSSSNMLKSLDRDDLARLLQALVNRFADANVTVAITKEDSSIAPKNVERFIFDKSEKNSTAFLSLLDETDLFVAVDAGPLHIADALGLRTIGLFGPTAPETILDIRSGILPLRIDALDGVYCFIEDCKDPVCMHDIFSSDPFEREVGFDHAKKIVVESEKCLARV